VNHGASEKNMQDIYAFDVGDYGKLGLLRHLMAHDLNVGVIWWKTELGSPGQDGKHVSYLQDQKFRNCDPDLWDAIVSCIQEGPRSIAALESLFPDGTAFCSDIVPSDSNRRLLWFDKALKVVGNADVVFCDPDNGIAFTDTTRSQRHISLSEVQRLYDAGRSVVLYHHPDRSCAHLDQIANRVQYFSDNLTQGKPVWAAHFRRGTSRVYFILPQPRHADAIQAALRQLDDSPWSRQRHFDIYAD
jgi:hypothetical protein